MGKEKVIAMDLETFPGVDPWHSDARIRMAIISDQVGRSWVIQTAPDGKLPQWVYGLLEDPSIIKCGSNIGFDYRWLRRFGCNMVNLYDTSTAEHIVDESNPKKDLKSLTFTYLPRLGDYSAGHRALVRERGGWEHVEDHEMYPYAGGDGEASIAAYLGQRAKLVGFERPAHLFKKLYSVLANMEHSGACVDLNTTRRLDGLYKAKLSVLRQDIVDILGPINPNSPSVLAKALRQKIPNINLRVREWARVLGEDDTEEISTKREILEREKDKHPIIAKVLEFRSYRTRHSTFITGVLEKYAKHRHNKDFIHPSFHTDRVETYRLSSSRPNGQNIPRKDNDDAELTVKQQFVSRFDGGYILDADQSQIEIRFAAWISKDPKMIAAVESGEDIHTAMAAKMLFKPIGEITEEERDRCKNQTFRVMYGGGAKGLAQALHIQRRDAEKLIREYYGVFSGLKQFIDDTHLAVQKTLDVVTPWGFRRQFVAPDHWQSIEGFTIQRQAFNTIVQNGAACITYCAMIWFQEQLEKQGMRSKMVLQVHDSIVVDVHPDETDWVINLARTAMEVAAPEMAREQYGVDIDIPLKCNIAIGKNWGETQEV